MKRIIPFFLPLVSLPSNTPPIFSSLHPIFQFIFLSPVLSVVSLLTPLPHFSPLFYRVILSFSPIFYLSLMFFFSPFILLSSYFVLHLSLHPLFSHFLSYPIYLLSLNILSYSCSPLIVLISLPLHPMIHFLFLHLSFPPSSPLLIFQCL